MTKQVAFHTLRRKDFPLTIELVRESDHVVVWHEIITGAGALEVPAIDSLEGPKPFYTRATTPDGSIFEVHLPPQ